MSPRLMPLAVAAALAGGLIATAACNTNSFATFAGCDFDDDASAGVQGVLFKSAGDGQTAVAGTQLNLTVHLVDVAQQNLCQKTITWTPAAASGTANPTQSVTDDTQGSASTVWTLGTTPGTQTLTASVDNSAPALSVVFTATVTAAGTFQLEVVSGDSQSAPTGNAVPSPLVVKFVDIAGNPGPATTLTWQAAGGGNAGQPTTTSSGSTGLSQNSWTLGPSGTVQTMTVSEPGGSSVAFAAISTPAGGTHPLAEIRAYNGSLSGGVTFSLHTPFDSLRTLGPLGANVQISDSMQVEVGVPFIIGTTVGGKTGVVTCTTTAAIIPDPGDTVNTGNALVAMFTDSTGTPVLTCNGNGWH